jgi:hypothetical protein
VTEYSEAVAQEICDRLAAGEGMVAICRDAHMPSQASVYRWLVADKDGFGEKYARAREAQADTLFNEILEIADDARNDWMERNGEGGGVAYQLNGEHVQRSRLRVDARKWMAGKLRPKVYGDKVDHEHKGAISVLVAPEHDGI